MNTISGSIADMDILVLLLTTRKHGSAQLLLGGREVLLRIKRFWIEAQAPKFPSGKLLHLIFMLLELGIESLDRNMGDIQHLVDFQFVIKGGGAPYDERGPVSPETGKLTFRIRPL